MDLMENKTGLPEMMKHCTRGCRWCPFMPLVFGIVMLLIGYFLDVGTVRVLGLILSGVVIVMGLFCFTMMRSMFRR